MLCLRTNILRMFCKINILLLTVSVCGFFNTLVFVFWLSDYKVSMMIPSLGPVKNLASTLLAR